MYVNDLPIYYYFTIGIIGLLIGQYMDWVIKRLRAKERVICKDFFKSYLKSFHINIPLMLITAAIYIFILYFHGITFECLEYLLITPILVGVFEIDRKDHIIPNRLVLCLFEIGIVFAILFGSGLITGANGINILIQKGLGLIAAFVIFYLIAILSKAISKKDGFGFGDVKLMAALGLIFGFSDILIISLLSFLIGAITSLIMIIAKKKKAKDYIAFGPFIVIAALTTIFVPHSIMVLILLKIFTLGFYKSN